MKRLFSLLLVLCLMCSATPVLCEYETQEIKVGKATFQIPTELSGGMYNTESFMEAHDYACTDYGITIAAFDLAELERFPALADCFDHTHMNDDHRTALYWALQLFAGYDVTFARALAKGANVFNVTSDGGATLLASPKLGVAVSAHVYHGTAFFIGSFAKVSTFWQQELDAITLDIAASFRLEGVTEEEMAADAAAAAAQKYIVITNASANIRAKADSKSDKITTAYQGDTFPLLGEEGTWYKIEVNGQTAYVSQGLCKIKE